MLSSQIMLLRRSAGMSQAQLAKLLHISPSTLGMYEQGRRTPGIEMLVQMSRIFNVSLDYIITGSEFDSYKTNSADDSGDVVCPCCRICCYRLHNKVQNLYGN